MRLILAALISGVLASSATAHDFWIQPSAYRVETGSRVTVSLYVGHGEARELWDADIRRIVRLTATGAEGVVGLDGVMRQGGQGDLSFAAGGLHALALETSPTTSELPADRFEAYLREEGLTPAIEARRRAGTSDRPGREIYSRRAKALVLSGGPSVQDEAIATTPIGLTLEIVPDRNPYANDGGPQGFVVHYEGRILEDAQVELIDLSADEQATAAGLTDAFGRVVFDIPTAGPWLVNVVWTKPLLDDPRGDFETIFSSLTFGR
ncbi:DUF4198 domain-containing protein [Brevundimonas sp. AAP58]|uniref:DUF4198 domain-containing protein n=1 Tax=Brevundimonas sp. AAP58 TaxID=1523422 RepID=UPI0009EA0437|nr:DUF4198 domain-containing protein [Brevundimonas sp. AAP58]